MRVRPRPTPHSSPRLTNPRTKARRALLQAEIGIIARTREFRYYYPVVDPINDCVYNSGNGQDDRGIGRRRA